jgi:hypothetical protein
MLPLLAGKPDDPTYLIAIGLGAFALIYLVVLRPMLRKRKDPLERAPARTGLAQQRAVERDMQGFLVEYEQMIRNMTAGLDTRAAKLEVLIKQADDRIEALREATANAAALGVAPRRGDAQAAGAVSSPDAVTAAAVERAVDLTPSPRRESANGPDPRHAEVYALADQGLSARDVARRLGRPNGEIELILALRPGVE